MRGLKYRAATGRWRWSRQSTRGVIGAVTAGALAVLPTVAAAHDTWMLPARFEVPPGAAVELEVTSAMRFPTPESAPDASRVEATGIRLGSRTVDLKILGATKSVLRLRSVPSQPGVATLWLASRPRTLELKDAEVEHYLKEIGAWETAGARWISGGRRPWRETYVKFTKTFVRVGSAKDQSWSEPVGLGLELVPLVDPTTLRAGDDLGLQLLRDGRPVAGQAVAAQAAGRAPELRQTDEGGRVSFVTRADGAWLVKTTLVEPAEGEWSSRFSTLTLSVRAARGQVRGDR
jgi:uncharacterized protein DUF4198